MIKEIEQTGMKYLCKRKQNINNPDDHIKYQGSGVYWKRVLAKHPEYTIKTTVLGLYSEEELKQKGLYYSDLYNIVESSEWANLIKEVGDGGDTSNTESYINGMRNRKGQSVKGWKTYYNPTTLETKRIGPNENPPEGFVRGNVPGRGYGPKKDSSKVFNNGETKRYIKNGDPIPEGFIPGVHYEGTTKGRTGCYNPLTLEKRYIRKTDPLPDGFVFGIPPTTGKKISTPYGFFDGIASCMRFTNLSRYKIEKNLLSNTDWRYCE